MRSNFEYFEYKIYAMQSKYFIIGLIAVFIACTSKKTEYTTMPDEKLMQVADSLAQAYIIVDGHVDLPYRLTIKRFRLTKEFLGIPVNSNEGDFDYVRAKKGGLDAPFMSIYIPTDQQQAGMAKNLADSLMDMVDAIVNEHPDKFAPAGTPDDIIANTKAGKISLPFGMENGAPIENDLANVQYFYNRGIRYITLTHSKDNQIGDSSGDTTRTWGGLSPFGIEVVKEMNRIGIMVDISHVHDSTFYQVMKLTNVPCIASHSSCRVFAPTVKRDMTDDMIKKMGENGGVIMINFYNAFLDSSVVNQNDRNRKKLNAILEEKKLTFQDSLAKPIVAQFEKDNPSLKTDVQMVANHIDHIVRIAGIDHVGIGSDYDGVDGELPTGLEDVSKYPNLIFELLKRGYSPEDIEKICSGNVFRVWNKVIEAAEKQ